MNSDLAAMEATLRAQLAGRRCSIAATATFQRAADARYVGQGYELRARAAARRDRAPASSSGARELPRSCTSASTAITSSGRRSSSSTCASRPSRRCRRSACRRRPRGGSLAAARMRIDDVVFRVARGARVVSDGVLRPQPVARRRADRRGRRSCCRSTRRRSCRRGCTVEVHRIRFHADPPAGLTTAVHLRGVQGECES